MTHREMERIGKVNLDLSKYFGKDSYTDGTIEDIMLKACESDTAEQLLKESSNYAVLYHLSDLRHNLLEWYPFKQTDRVLEIGSGCGALTGLFSDRCKHVTCVELSKKRSLINAYRNKNRDNIEIIIGNFQDVEPELGQYEIITLIGVWEYSKLYISDKGDSFDAMLRIAKSHLAPDGHLLIAIENKMGIKYLNGAPEDHTNHQYSGVNDYINGEVVNTFSKPEIESRLRMAGFAQYDFYYPLPDYKLPSVIYSDRYQPKPSDIRIFGQEYASVRFSHFNEAAVYDQICADGQFDYFANSFLISVGSQSPVVFASYQRERLLDKRIATVICECAGEFVVKKHGFTNDADAHIQRLEKNQKNFMESGLSIEATRGRIQEGIYCENYISGNTLEEEFFALRHDTDAFIKHFIQIREDYLVPPKDKLMPFEYTEEFGEVFGHSIPEKALSMKTTNVDLILSNLKRYGNGIIAFDMEWCFDFPIPYDFPIWRAAKILYEKYNLYLNKKITKRAFLNGVGFDDKLIKIYEDMEECFSYYVTGQDKCEVYSNNYRKQIITPQYKIY